MALRPALVERIIRSLCDLRERMGERSSATVRPSARRDQQMVMGYIDAMQRELGAIAEIRRGLLPATLCVALVYVADDVVARAKIATGTQVVHDCCDELVEVILQLHDIHSACDQAGRALDSVLRQLALLQENDTAHPEAGSVQ